MEKVYWSQKYSYSSLHKFYFKCFSSSYTMHEKTYFGQHISPLPLTDFKDSWVVYKKEFSKNI
jgi:hypothetical protein